MSTEPNIPWLIENYEKNFEILYKNLYRRMFLFARNFLMDENAAEDIVQEVFLALWTKGRHLSLHLHLESYLFASLRNLCVDYHRKLGVINRYQQHLKRVEATMLFPFEEKKSIREQKISALFAGLPEMQRKVLELSILEGLKYKEVAARLKISEGTVHTHVKRAYKFIKNHMLLFIFSYSLAILGIFSGIHDENIRFLYPKKEERSFHSQNIVSEK